MYSLWEPASSVHMRNYQSTNVINSVIQSVGQHLMASGHLKQYSAPERGSQTKTCYPLDLIVLSGGMSCLHDATMMAPQHKHEKE